MWKLRFLFVYLGFEGFLKIISSYNPLIHIGIDILSLFLLAGLFLGKESRFQRGDGAPPLKYLFAFHLLWFSICVLNPFSLGIVPSLASAKIYVTMPLLYFSGFYLIRSLKEFEQIAWIWILVLAAHTATSIYQGTVGPSSVLSIHPGYAIPLERLGGPSFRPFGLTHLPGAPSVFIFLTLPLVLYFLFQKRSILVKAFLSALIPAASIVLVLCQVRSAILKSLLGSILFVLLNFAVAAKTSVKTLLVRTAVVLLVCVVGAFVVDAYLPKVDEFALNRSLSAFNVNSIRSSRGGFTERFSTYFEMAPFGAGLSRTGAAAEKFREANDSDSYFSGKFFTDNLWLTLQVDLGFPGMIVFSALAFSALLLGFRAVFKLKNPEYRLPAAAISSALLCSALGAFGAEAFLYNPEAAFFWFFSGVLMRFWRIDQAPFAAARKT